MIEVGIQKNVKLVGAEVRPDPQGNALKDTLVLKLEVVSGGAGFSLKDLTGAEENVQDGNDQEYYYGVYCWITDIAHEAVTVETESRIAKCRYRMEQCVIRSQPRRHLIQHTGEEEQRSGGFDKNGNHNDSYNEPVHLHRTMFFEYPAELLLALKGDSLTKDQRKNCRESHDPKSAELNERQNHQLPEQ